jgi:hypothetical protein
MFQAQSSVHQFDDPFEPDPACPTIAIDGNRVTITGGCTTATPDMIEIQGSAVITNPLGWGDLEYEFNSDSHYELVGFTVIQSGFRTSFDGHFTLEPGYETIDADLTADMFQLVVRSDIYAECSRSAECDIGNSGLELVGVGGALVSGSIAAQGGGASANFTLRGVDTLRVAISDGCLSWQIEGTDRMSPPCP